MQGRVYFFPDNPKGCNRFENVTLDKEVYDNNDINFNPIVIVERGHCTFVKKARNIQELGGMMALIVNNNPVTNAESVVIGDDGTGSSIVIPTVLIGHKEGKIIIDYLNDSIIEKYKKAQVSISANFYMENPDDRVEYDIWYVPTQNTSYQFISKFHPYNKHLGKNVLMTPRMVLSSCVHCGNDWDEFCYSGHKYCAAPDQNQVQKGREIILEGLRQKCIYNISFDKDQGEKWWDYIDYVKSYC